MNRFSIEIFDETLRNVRQMGDIIASSAMVEKEHDWAVWGGIAEGLGGRAFGVATALQTQLENQEIRARNAANQRYANSQRQEIYDLVAKKERERPVVRTAMILYNQFKFIKWDQTELFKKIKVVTNSLVVSDDSAGFILYADFYGLDRNVIIDGTIRAKLYDENHLYVGQALLTLPEFGTDAEKNIFYGYIPNPPASKYYSVVYEPYYLWQIEANKDSPVKSVSDLSWAMAKFGKPNLNVLAQKHEDELHYANAVRLLKSNDMTALSEAQAEIKLMSNSSEAKVFTEKFNAATISLKDEIYNSAVKLAESTYIPDVEKAVEKFAVILDWKDVKSLSEKTSAKVKYLKNDDEYQKGIVAFENKDYSLARTHFAECAKWKDSIEYIKKCENAIKKQKKDIKIKIIFIFICLVVLAGIWLSYSKNKQYNEAISLIENKQYGEAYTVLMDINDDETTDSLKKQCISSLIKDNNYKEAYRLVHTYNDHSNNQEQENAII